jgi:Flp pilus assembly protein TadG
MNQTEQTLQYPGRRLTGELSWSVPPHGSPAKAGQDGGIALMFAGALIVMLGFSALALEISQLYNRKVEMTNLADAVAIAAARNLNGTAAGVTSALTAASQTAALYTYGYGKIPISWSDSAISFSTSPDRSGTWVDAGTASGMAARMLYVRVDTSGLSDSPGSVQMSLIQVLSESLETVEMNATAIAGRAALDMTPLAICAMANSNTSRTNAAGVVELVEYGFRRGVSYDLMRLSPIAATPPTPLNYVVNPLAVTGASGSASDTDAATVGPYVCAGTLGSPRLLAGEALVTSSFPIGLLWQQLNSRFDQYGGNLCDFNGAPPDKNIKQYTYNTSVPWVTTTPLAQQTAAESTAGNKLMTIADLPPPGGTAVQYGPVWAYAKAVQYAATEPAAGYTAFAASNTNWSALYGGQTPTGYPAGTSTPYKATVGTNYAAPNAAHRPMADRRVLNVPLLSCPVPAGTNVSATVLATGRFFMTVPATSTSIYAEFAGAVPLARVTGDVELF